MKLYLTNTLTKKKEVFTPREPNHVSLYVCGITPYDFAHLGHGRCYVNFDLLVRLLRMLGKKVTYVRNYTDIDDKLINKAHEQGGTKKTYQEIAENFIAAYQEDMKSLNCLEPEVEPKVTTHITPIITFVEQLIEHKKAYVVDGNVYFDIKSFPEYGKLSGKKLEDQQAGSRVAIDERKRNPEDFALWKGNNEQLFWESPWGYGRPGWHIECSALANEYLGKTIDIHAGGMDLIFPHHENEIAQSESLHKKPFANVWLHNAFVNINKEKMSKSLGNFITLKGIFKAIDPMVLRYFFIQHHYRTPLDFNFHELESVKTAYKKLISAVGSTTITQGKLPQLEKLLALHPLLAQIIEALCDDLNTPKFLGIVFEHLSDIKESPELAAGVQIILQDILGLTLRPLQEEEVEVTPKIKSLIEQRQQAREQKNWKKADEIRDQLTGLGYQPKDSKS